MKKVLYRFFLDYEKEEKWVNERAAEGWHLEKFSLGRFVFTKGEPGTYIFRNEFIRMTSSEKEDYFDFLKDSGITIINEWGGWVYMKKAAAEGPFEIYTDKESKISYYNRMLSVFSFLFLINAWFGIMNIGVLGDSARGGNISPTIGILNIIVALLIAYPIIKIYQRKKGLEKEDQFFK
ncbi:DUF2812 domain-containing protein [Bacillus sp. S/N-304-OC-R1]|uniref:DUF2812 domain-containing protein n=1 Tax=Bacillus sp. S/N-304-OC-R1 TaxID=2758034 RepID=UPI001C8D0BFE|nr:DUF2812 domain-containing protein [Bacillus sp. S/N-304-OC-R1]MBY0122117.1 DUF2812 domain-containing protein [Bacillus sp. S/N-304-OC-R1]